MTTETLDAHVKAFHAGAITVRDHSDMVAELARRFDDFELSKSTLKERIESAVATILGEDE